MFDNQDQIVKNQDGINQNDEYQKSILVEERIVKKHKYRLKKSYRNKLLIILGSFIMVVYLAGFLYFNNCFLPNTYINGFDVSQLSLSKATQKIETAIEANNLTLTFIDGKTETVKQSDCGFQINTQNDIEIEYKKQNKWLWFIESFKTTKIDIENLLSIDNAKLTQVISQLEHFKEENQIEPVDAVFAYENNEFSIKAETYGSKINTEKFNDLIIHAFEYGQTELNVKEAGGYIAPNKTADDKSLVKLLEAAKKYATAVITYQSTTGDIVLDGNTIVSWLSIDENGDYYRDDDEFKTQAESFVQDTLAPKINIVGKRKTFTGAGGRKLTVSGGNYGYKLNQEKEVEGLIEDIYAGKKITRTPVTTGVQASYSNGGLGNTFVEIDMTKQHFWLHKNGEIVLESDVVTGLPSDPGRKTPSGTYYIYLLQRDRILRGTKKPDGTWPYETPVDFWMAFNKGIGLHDATWQSKFGGNVYLTKGSHGCINLPYSVAQKLYSLLKVNMPVVCYY